MSQRDPRIARMQRRRDARRGSGCGDPDVGAALLMIALVLVLAGVALYGAGHALHPLVLSWLHGMHGMHGMQQTPTPQQRTSVPRAPRRS
jgi:hypothetical protein